MRGRGHCHVERAPPDTQCLRNMTVERASKTARASRGRRAGRSRRATGSQLVTTRRASLRCRARYPPNITRCAIGRSGTNLAPPCPWRSSPSSPGVHVRQRSCSPSWHASARTSSVLVEHRRDVLPRPGWRSSVRRGPRVHSSARCNGLRRSVRPKPPRRLSSPRRLPPDRGDSRPTSAVPCASRSTMRVATSIDRVGLDRPQRRIIERGRPWSLADPLNWKP